MLFVLPSPCVGCSVPYWCDLIELFKAPLSPLFPLWLPLTVRQLYAPLDAPSPPVSLHLLQPVSTYSWAVISIYFCSCFHLFLRKLLFPPLLPPLCTSDKGSPFVRGLSFLFSQLISSSGFLPMVFFFFSFIPHYCLHFPSPWPQISHLHWIPLPLTNFSSSHPLGSLNNIISKCATGSVWLLLLFRGPWSCSSCACLLMSFF